MTLSGGLLTLFLCKTCSALLTLFRAWTLVDPFSFAYKENKTHLTATNQKLEYTTYNSIFILQM